MSELYQQHLTRQQRAEQRSVPFGKHRYRSLGWISANDLMYLDFLAETVRLAELRADLEIVMDRHAEALRRGRNASEMLA